MSETSPPEDTGQPDLTRRQAIRAGQGDRTAFAALYERVGAALEVWAELRIPRSHRARLLPEDLVQEVWWRALDSFQRFDAEQRSFRAWIFTIATNVLLESYRVSAPRPSNARQESARIVELPDELAAQLTSIRVESGRRDDARRMAELMAELSEDERQVFLCRGLEGATTAEAAELLGIGEEACYSRWQRLRDKLTNSPLWGSLFETE